MDDCNFHGMVWVLICFQKKEAGLPPDKKDVKRNNKVGFIENKLDLRQNKTPQQQKPLWCFQYKPNTCFQLNYRCSSLCIFHL